MGMLILFYLFCSGKMEDNLTGIFNLFDQDGNKMITLNELYELMSVFIEISRKGEQSGPGKGDGGDVQAGGQEQGRCAGAGLVQGGDDRASGHREDLEGEDS